MVLLEGQVPSIPDESITCMVTLQPTLVDVSLLLNTSNNELVQILYISVFCVNDDLLEESERTPEFLTCLPVLHNRNCEALV